MASEPPPPGREGSSKLPSLDDVRAQLDHLKSFLDSDLDIASLGMPSKLPFKAATLQQTLLYRLVDLSTEAIRFFERESCVPGALLTRAAIETTALLSVLESLIVRTAESGSLPNDLDKQLMQFMFGSRTGKTSEEAVSVLTHLDKMNRRFAVVREWYDDLSELVHPNYAGLLGVYAKIDEVNFVVTYGPNANQSLFTKSMCLPVLFDAIVTSIHLTSAINDHFEKFIAISHRTPSSDLATGEPDP